MSDDLKLKHKTELSTTDDLVIKAARFGAFGWLVALVLLFVLITQNLVIALAGKQVLATHNGKVVGQVVFDEARLRPDDEVLADLKKWVSKCTSVNKVSIYEDLAICLNHMAPELAEKRLADYESNLYATRIEKYGCKDTEIAFKDSDTSLEREPLDYVAEATLSGEVICKYPNQEPLGQEFKIHVIASLTERTTYNPLAIRVTNSWDIVE
ncbi:MAG: hypothetical protein MI976_11425 [Pseudomonadales bacterium]|nr:hypothetical protein [Pseudomonadales bacterium]